MWRYPKLQRTLRLGRAHSKEVSLNMNIARLESDPFLKAWTKSPAEKRRAHVEALLENLEHRDTESRFTSARRLLYILQGRFYNLDIFISTF